MHPPRRESLPEGRPEGVQILGIATLATRAGMDSAIPLRKMNEQLRPFIDRDHDGHGDGGVLSEPCGFGQQQQLELFKGRTEFPARQHWRLVGSRPAEIVFGWLWLSISGLPKPQEYVRARRTGD